MSAVLRPASHTTPPPAQSLTAQQAATGSKADNPTGPLDGLKVLELGTLIAGPFAGRLLADYGADVVKIEAPERPDPLRNWGQESFKGYGLLWPVHARNKRCITLNLRTERGREIFLSLAEQADVVLENFRPGTLERWGLGYEQLRAVNKDIVLARVSGYGQTGPSATKAGYASVAEAAGGLRAISGHPGEPPPRMAVSLGDSLAGMVAVQGILAALYRRTITGEGQIVDVALTEACLMITESIIPEYEKLGRVRQPGGTRLDGVSPSNIYRCADDVWVVVAANQDTVFRRLCAAMGQPDLADDLRFVDHQARGENQDTLDAIVAAWVAQRTAAEVGRILDELGVVVGPINTAAEIVVDPQFIARGMLVEHFDERVGEPVLGPGVVPTFSATPGHVRWAGAPKAGHHNAEVFAEIGLDAGLLQELHRDGTI